MNFAAVRHIPKSPMAYAQDEETLHIYLETAKDDLQKAELIAGDPFDYIKLEGKYRWRPSSEKNLAMEKLYSGRHLDYWFLEVKAPSKRTKYAFILHAGGSRYFYGPRRISEIKEGFDLYDPFEYFNYPDIPKEDLPTFPEWAKTPSGTKSFRKDSRGRVRLAPIFPGIRSVKGSPTIIFSEGILRASGKDCLTLRIWASPASISHRFLKLFPRINMTRSIISKSILSSEPKPTLGSLSGNATVWGSESSSMRSSTIAVGSTPSSRT